MTNEPITKEDAELIIDALECLWDEWYSYDIDNERLELKEYRKKNREHIISLGTKLRKSYSIEKDKWADF